MSFPLKIKYYDRYAGKECIWYLIAVKLNLGEYQSELTMRTILMPLDVAEKYAVR